MVQTKQTNTTFSGGSTNKIIRSENIYSPLIGDDKEIGKVYETTDYSKFKLIPANREKKMANVRKLRASILKVGQLQNVLVDKDFNVGEGQHRIEIMEDLGWPIRYEIRNAMDIQKIQEIQRGTAWKTGDYTHAYTTVSESNPANRKSYELYNQFSKDFKLGHNMTLALICGTYSNSVPTEAFKLGRLNVNQQQYEKARTEASMVSDFGKYFKKYKSRAFVLAVFTLLKRVKGYNHPRMISQLEKNRYDLHPSNKAVHYVDNLVKIYNKWLPNAERIHFRPEDVIDANV